MLFKHFQRYSINYIYRQSTHSILVQSVSKKANVSERKNFIFFKTNSEFHKYYLFYDYVYLFCLYLKAYVSEEVLNWHSLSLSSDLCIYFYCLSRLRQVSQRKMIQSSALRLRLSQFKISSDTPALKF